MSFFGKVKRLIITDQVSKIYTQKTPPRTYIEWEKKVQHSRTKALSQAWLPLRNWSSLWESPSLPTLISCMSLGHQTLGTRTKEAREMSDSNPHRWLMESLTHILPQLLKLYRNKNESLEKEYTGRRLSRANDSSRCIFLPSPDLLSASVLWAV